MHLMVSCQPGSAIIQKMTQIAHLEVKSEGDRVGGSGLAAWVGAEGPSDLLHSGSRALPAAALGWWWPCLGFLSAGVPHSGVVGAWGFSRLEPCGAAEGGHGLRHAQRHKQGRAARSFSPRCRLLASPPHLRAQGSPGGPRRQAPRQRGSRPVPPHMGVPSCPTQGARPHTAPLLRPTASCRHLPSAAEANLAISST